MRKIMLFLEDYRERVYIETILKKTGYDVLSIFSLTGIANNILTFGPDCILVSQELKNVTLEDFTKKISKKNGKPKILVVGDNKPEIEDLKKIGVNSFLSRPVQPISFFKMLEKLGGSDAKAAILKIKNAKLLAYESVDVKIDGSDPNLKELPEIVKGAYPRSERIYVQGEKPENRNELYKVILENVETPDIEKSFDAETIDEYVASIEKLKRPEHEKMDEERKAFVKSIFRLAKKS